MLAWRSSADLDPTPGRGNHRPGRTMPKRAHPPHTLAAQADQLVGEWITAHR